MLKKLKRDALVADLNSVQGLLGARSLDEDPTGFLQYESRRQDIEDELVRLADVPDSHASLAVFFGGGPVHGSYGINADFAGGALEDVQELIKKCLATRELGQLPDRGRIPLRGNAQMLVTDVARGSFGFVLEEAGGETPLIDTVLKEVVDEVAELLGQIGSVDEHEFEKASEVLDSRILISLRQFFRRLDDGEATVRIVESDRDFLLDRASVSRARARTDAMEIEESGEEFEGDLFLLPDSRRFDMHTTIDGHAAAVSGSVTRDVMRQLEGQPELGALPIDPRDIPREPWRVILKVRKIRERGRAPRVAYSLARLIEAVKPRQGGDKAQ
ncbi:hypothetical protein [Burkholderia ubonensis]|uniref:hypothetical protein n=1 Tax=Burkholderia ubonensis TaxID=101571 RepID=UPI000AEA2AB6|nr:hypothetical protein [Burkholderia ubonensis]